MDCTIVTRACSKGLRRPDLDNDEGHDKQKSLAALRRAIDEGWRTLWWFDLKYDPNLESLHDEPEFQAMVAEIEADMAAQLARVREMERNGELEPIPEIAAAIQ